VTDPFGDRPVRDVPALRRARAWRLKLATRAILVVGFTASIVVYVVAAARPENPLGDPMQSKQYLHDLELYGGTANVLATEFREWFAGLWSGKNLAYTIAVLTLIVVGAVRFFAIPVPAARGPARQPPRPPRSAA
jgi:hypothetical protein